MRKTLLRDLRKPESLTCVLILLLSMTQWWYVSQQQDWGLWFVFNMLTWGTFLTHGLIVMMHECVHSLASGKWDDVWGLTSNLMVSVPFYGNFKAHHLLHHQHLNVIGKDPELITPDIANWCGSSSVKKLLYLFLYPFILLLQPFWYRRFRVRPLFVFNTALQVAVNLWILTFYGVVAWTYWMGCTYWSLCPLHPLATHWIAAHFRVERQLQAEKTFSYYGDVNMFIFNIGFHREHYAYPKLPWTRLPFLKMIHDSSPKEKPPVRRIAYFSYLDVVVRFITDARVCLGLKQESDPLHHPTNLQE